MKNQGNSASQSARADRESLTKIAAARRSAVKSFLVIAIFATIAFLAAQAFGQAPAYKSEKLDPALLQKAAASSMEQARREGISKRDMTPQWERFKAFEAYYTRLVFGKLKDDAYLGELGTLTQSLLEDLDRANKAGSPAASLIRGYIIEMGKQIAPGNYHPAARINATLLLSLVDDAPDDPRNRKPPVPSAAAFGPLVSLYMKADNPDGVRAAALQGIARHVALGAVKTPQYRAGVSKLMMDLAKSEPPAGRSAAAHAFMQRYAVDILSVLANPNASPDTTKTLVALSTDKKKPSLIAAYAASKIGALQPGKATVDKLPEVLQTWAGRAADTIEGELTRIANLDPPVAVRDQPQMPSEDPMAANAAGTGGFGASSMEGYSSSMMSDSMSEYSSSSMSPDSMEGYGAMMNGMMMPGMAVVAQPKPPEVITSLRRINHLLQQLQLGATGQAVTGAPAKPAGLLAAATPGDKAAVDKWITTVGDVVTAINADTIDDKKKLVEELTKQAAILRELSGVKPVPGAPAVGGAPGVPNAAGPAFDPFAGMQPGAAPVAGAANAAAGPGPVGVAPAAVPTGSPVVPPTPSPAPSPPAAVAPAASVPAVVTPPQPAAAGVAAPAPAAPVPANPADPTNGE